MLNYLAIDQKLAESIQEYIELSIQRETMTKIVKSRYKLPTLGTKSTLDALWKPT